MAEQSTRPTESVDVSNLVVLVGTIVGEPTVRSVGTADAWQFDLATTVADGDTTRRVSVPVNWLDPAAREATTLREGAEVLVVGSVRRRFFRVGGVTQSRTEVVPARVVPTRRRAAIRGAIDDVVARLSRASAPPAR